MDICTPPFVPPLGGYLFWGSTMGLEGPRGRAFQEGTIRGGVWGGEGGGGRWAEGGEGLVRALRPPQCPYPSLLALRCSASLPGGIPSREGGRESLDRERERREEGEGRVEPEGEPGGGLGPGVGVYTSHIPTLPETSGLLMGRGDLLFLSQNLVPLRFPRRGKGG